MSRKALNHEDVLVLADLFKVEPVWLMEMSAMKTHYNGVIYWEYEPMLEAILTRIDDGLKQHGSQVPFKKDAWREAP